jgi:hypothetical protein
VDAVVWVSSAAASLGSGILLAAFGFTALCLLGGAVVLGPITLVARQRATVHSSLQAAAAPRR